MAPLDILSVTAVASFLILMYSWIRFKGSLGIITLAFYCLIAVMCRFFASQGVYPIAHLKLWPFLYYIALSFIFALPLLSHDKFAQKVKLKNIKFLNKLSDFYIIMSFVYVLIMYSVALNAIQSGAWLEVYLDVHEEDALLYGNIYERLVMNFISYLKIPILIYVFYVFSHGIEYKRKLLALICPFINTVFYAMFTASRTSLFIILILYLISYIVFKDGFSDSFKRTIRIGIIIIGLIAGGLVVGISISRFGEGEYDWLANYFGNSIRVGHDMIGFTDSYSYGTHFSEHLIGMFDVKPIDFHCSIDNGHSFHPLIGMRYVDYGFLGTFFYAIICAIIFGRLMTKRSIGLGDLYLIFYYFQDLLIGCLYESTTATTWLMVLFISIILNKITLTHATPSNSVLSSPVLSGEGK